MAIAGAPVQFKMPIAPDESIRRRPYYLRDALKEPELAPASFHWKSDQSYRNTTRIAIQLATHNRINNCELKLVLSENYSSTPVSCSELIDNQLNVFEFSDPIPPGVYDVKLESDATSNQNGISVYVSIPRKTEESWVLPYSVAKPIVAFDSYLFWAAESPGKFLVILFGTIVFFVSLFGQKYLELRTRVLLVGVALFGNFFALTPPLAGHDETAHISMLNHARQDLLLEKNLPVTERVDFYNDIQDIMYDSDFYRFHKANALPRDRCPHWILRVCGVSSRPIWLYRQYSKILSLFDEAPWSGSTYLTVGKWANSVILAIILGCAWFFLAYRRVFAFLVLLIFSGGIMVQIPSVTNDVPMFFVGLLGLLVATKVFDRSRILYRVLWGLGYLGLVAGVSHIDRSYLAGMPFALFLIFVGFFNIQQPPAPSSQSSSLSPSVASVVNGTLIVVVVCALTTWSLWYTSHVIDNNPGPIFNWFRGYMDDLNLFLSLKDVPRSDMPILLYFYARSIAGTYMWGHSFLAAQVYFVWVTLVLIIPSILGIRYLLEIGGKYKKLCLAVLGVLIGIQVVVVLTVASDSLGVHLGAMDAQLKARLTAPGLAAIFLLPFLGFVSISKCEKWRPWLLYGTLTWSLIMTFYYLPHFYISERF